MLINNLQTINTETELETAEVVKKMEKKSMNCFPK